MNAGGVFGLFVLMVSMVAYAQPAPPSDAKREAARLYVEDGVAAQNRGEFDAAISLYNRAYELIPHPVLLFNIAQALRLAGRIEQADSFYQRFLATNPTGPEAQIARDVRAEIAEARRARAPRPEPPPDPIPHSADTSRIDPPQPAESPSPSMTNVAATRIDSRSTPPWYSDKLGDALAIGGVAATVAAIILYRSALYDADTARMEKDDYMRALDLRDGAREKANYAVGLAV